MPLQIRAHYRTHMLYVEYIIIQLIVSNDILKDISCYNTDVSRIIQNRKSVDCHYLDPMHRNIDLFLYTAKTIFNSGVLLT